MKKIYKQHLELVSGPQILKMPRIHKIVLVGEQDGKPTVWYQFDEHEDGQWGSSQEWHVYGTGHTIKCGLEHMGSYQSATGHVWHVYADNSHILTPRL